MKNGRRWFVKKYIRERGGGGTGVFEGGRQGRRHLDLNFQIFF
jgi:hypothetical protein